MAKIKPFEEFTEEYEEWFEKNKYVYKSEIEAIGKILPNGKGIEIGVGSARFAEPLKVKYGIDPSLKMLKIAKKRGIKVIMGVAENLPLKSKKFDYVLLTTTVCFLDDIEKSFEEIKRILKKGGYLIIGFIDKNSKLGKFYEKKKKKSPFYEIAKFYSTEEIIELLKKKKFKNFKFYQTIFKNPSEIKKPEPVKEGYGEGSFIVIKAKYEKI